jgi:hypothetical protein
MPIDPLHAPAALGLLASIPALAAADTPAADSFGAGCAGASGVEPTLTAPPFAVDGLDFALEIECGPSLAGLLFIGVNKDAWLGFPLPLDLTIFQAPGCELLVSPDLTVPWVADIDGHASIVLPGYGLGIEFHYQAFVYDFDPQTFDPLLALSAGASVPGVLPSGREPGDLVITEIMKNPSFVSDTTGEWFEIYNTTSEAIDLSRWCLTDDAGQSLVLSPATPLIIAPFSYAVLGSSADPVVNGGIDVLYGWSQDGAFSLSNNDDTIRLVTPDGVVVDGVNYQAGAGWQNPIGASLELAEGTFEHDVNDDGSVWDVAACYIGGSGGFNTDRGSPGMPTGSCPNPQIPYGSGELIFCEVMQNPSGVSDALGEWFEVHNTTDVAIDMAGYTLTLGGGSFTVTGPLIVEPDGYRVFARNGDPALNGGLPADVYDYPDTLALSNGSQTLTLSDATGATVCLLQYDNGVSYPDPSGASMALDPSRLTLLDAIDGTAWCVSTTAFGASGDFGTPGVSNDPCGP